MKKIRTIFFCFSIYLLFCTNLAFSQSKSTFEWDPEHHLKADIYYPDTTEKHPAVLLIHGGGWMAGSRNELEWFGNYLAMNGVVAISIDYRLVNEFTNATVQYSDIKNALQVIIQNQQYLNIDENRIGVLGGSAGGHLAAMLATESNTPIKAAVILWGPTNLNDESNVSVQGKQIYQRYIHYSPFMNKKEFSPYYRLNSSMCRNWLIIHGDLDELVPTNQSIAMHNKLLSFGADSKLLLIPGMTHTPKSSQTMRQAMNDLILFFKTKLAIK